MKVKNRKVFNISWNNTTAKQVQIGMNFEFMPNELIVRSVNYDTNDNLALQIGSDIVKESVLCSFLGIRMMQELENHFSLGPNFPQNRTWLFQTQTPPSGTGVGVESTTATGIVSLMLEFIEH